MKKGMKRFYSQVEIAEKAENAASSFQILLDGRVLKSPAGEPLLLPNASLAACIKTEWDQVEQDIHPDNMPYFSAAATVIDRVMPQTETLKEQLIGFAGNELICYRAPDDERELYSHQQQHWDSWLEWAENAHHISLNIQSGIMPVKQDEQSLQHCRIAIEQYDDWYLSCFVRAAQISGSFVLSLAFMHQKIDYQQLFNLSFLEELYQNERWGCDDEAAARQQQLKTDLKDVSDFLQVISAA